MHKVMQTISAVGMLVDHVKDPTCRHGVFCSWCFEEKRDPTAEQTLYVHPEPAYLYASERQLGRKWLLWSANSRYNQAMTSLIKGYQAKYNFDVGLLTLSNGIDIVNHLKWLQKDSQRMRMISYYGDTFPLKALANFAEQGSTTWITWNKPTSLGLTYKYKYSTSGQPSLTVTPSDTMIQGALIHIYTSGSIDPMVLQKCLYTSIVLKNGHRGLSQLMKDLFVRLSAHGTTPIIESNVELSVHDFFFGFEYLRPIIPQEVTSPAGMPPPPSPPMPRTEPDALEASTKDEPAEQPPVIAQPPLHQ